MHGTRHSCGVLETIMDLARGTALSLSQNESAQWAPCSADAGDPRPSRGLAMVKNDWDKSENLSLSVITVTTTEPNPGQSGSCGEWSKSGKAWEEVPIHVRRIS